MLSGQRMTLGSSTCPTSSRAMQSRYPIIDTISSTTDIVRATQRLVNRFVNTVSLHKANRHSGLNHSIKTSRTAS